MYLYNFILTKNSLESKSLRRHNLSPRKRIAASMSVRINCHFVGGAYVEILGDEVEEFSVKFIDSDTGTVVYECLVTTNSWARTARQFFTAWRIQVLKSKGQTLIFDHHFSCLGENVFIAIESNALGDTLAWLPAVEAFRVQHRCNITCSTFLNELFIDVYPEICFVKPGEQVHNLYAMFRLGMFYNSQGERDHNLHSSNFLTQPMAKVAFDILGLEFEQIRPKIFCEDLPSPSSEPYVCIAVHASAQAKYWNSLNGWAEVIDFISSKGLRVLLLSREGYDYMGNTVPTTALSIPSGSLKNIVNYMRHAKFFIGVASGLSWLAWAVGCRTCLISGFSFPHTEMEDCLRIFPKVPVCTGCFNRHKFNAHDWNWCPDHKNEPRMFECTKAIDARQVIEAIQHWL